MQLIMEYNNFFEKLKLNISYKKKFNFIWNMIFSNFIIIISCYLLIDDRTWVPIIYIYVGLVELNYN